MALDFDAVCLGSSSSTEFNDFNLQSNSLNPQCHSTPCGSLSIQINCDHQDTCITTTNNLDKQHHGGGFTRICNDDMWLNVRNAFAMIISPPCTGGVHTFCF
eukprot:230605_1